METKPQEPLRGEPVADLFKDSERTLTPGELYLYHRTNRRCPPRSSLWGIFAHAEGQAVHLESSTRDLLVFRFWHELPEGYCYCRLATRSELRDYVASLTYREALRQERTLRLIRPALLSQR